MIEVNNNKTRALSLPDPMQLLFLQSLNISTHRKIKKNEKSDNSFIKNTVESRPDSDLPVWYMYVSFLCVYKNLFFFFFILFASVVGCNHCCHPMQMQFQSKIELSNELYYITKPMELCNMEIVMWYSSISLVDERKKKTRSKHNHFTLMLWKEKNSNSYMDYSCRVLFLSQIRM